MISLFERYKTSIRPIVPDKIPMYCAIVKILSSAGFFTEALSFRMGKVFITVKNMRRANARLIIYAILLEPVTLITLRRS